MVHRPKIPTTLETESRERQVQGQSGQHLNMKRKRRAEATAQLQVLPNLHRGLGLVSSMGNKEEKEGRYSSQSIGLAQAKP